MKDFADNCNQCFILECLNNKKLNFVSLSEICPFSRRNGLTVRQLPLNPSLIDTETPFCRTLFLIYCGR